MSKTDNEIDEGLFSRQLYTLGKEAMQKIRQKKILISGLNGVGLEVAKNVILSGVYQVSLYDDQEMSSKDMSSMFYGCEDFNNVGKSRANVVYNQLCELNEYVRVLLLEETLTEKLVSEFDIVVLCDAKSNEVITKINNWCRSYNRIFINTIARGLFGMVFCDFGEKYLVKDVAGYKPASHELATIEKAKDGLVYVATEKGHGLCDESYVTFSNVEGMTELNDKEPLLISVNDYKSFYIGDNTQYNDYIPNTGTVKEIMMPKTLSFKPYEEFLQCMPSHDVVLIGDYSKLQRPSTLHLCFVTLNKYYEKYNELPQSWSASDADKFLGLFKEVAGTFNVECKEEEVVKIFSYVARGNLNPIHAILGGIVGQEVLKGASQQFCPIRQFYYIDYMECLPEKLDDRINSKVFEATDCRYDGQISVFGADFQRQLGDIKVFVVGAGAIGCEMLKNLAMIGLSDRDYSNSQSGRIFVTDMDHIERSNLNRQFLFRNNNIGHPKSTTAAAVVQKMNPSISIVAHTNQLGADTEEVYNNAFFKNLHCVLNALDAVDARLYAASRIEFNDCPMIDSGTLGTQCSQQVILPGISKTYFGQQAQQDAIPICTIKNFPYQIEHTIQWAKDLFTTYFTTTPKLAETFIKNKKEFFEHIEKLSKYQKFDAVSQVISFLNNKPTSFDDCIVWALEQWTQFFSTNIQQILHSFPPDHKTTDGLPFWCGTKRVPQFDKFDINQSHHLDFVIFATKLRCTLFKIDIGNDEHIKQVINSYEFPKFVPTDEKIATDDAELEKMLDMELLKSRIESLNKLDVDVDLSIEPQEFEKDDDSNFHIDFITAASNNRATNYTIPTADRFKTKQIAGRIIPAIATSTSLITGQVCMELFKIIQGHTNIRKFRDSYVNLSSPIFTMTIPEKPQKFKVLDKQYNVWDKFDVEGDITLKQFIEFMKTKSGFDIDCVTYKTGVLYADWMDKEYLDDNMSRKITNIIFDKLKLPIIRGENVIPLYIGLSDEDGNDIERVPPVRYSF